MNKTIIFLLFSVLLFSNELSAQIIYEDKRLENASDSISKVTVVSYSKEPKRKKSGTENSLKIGLLDAIYGHQSIYYERRLNKFLSVQAGLGISFRSFYEDFSFSVENFNRYSSDEFYNANYGSLSTYKNTRKSKPGISVSVNPKIYTGGWAAEGFYLSPFFRYQINRYRLVFDYPDQNEIQNKMIIGLHIGGQNNNRPLCLDYGVGVGYKIIKNNRYLTDVSDADGSSMPDGMYDFDIKGFSFEIYLRIGSFFNFKKKS